MKKLYGIARAVPMATVDDLQKMPTKALLARLARLRMCEESLAVSDLSPEEADSASGILFKSTPEWLRAFDQVKEELSTREHVPRPIARRNAKNPADGPPGRSVGRRKSKDR
jgi:hypothetical protein